MYLQGGFFCHRGTVEEGIANVPFWRRHIRHFQGPSEQVTYLIKRKRMSLISNVLNSD